MHCPSGTIAGAGGGVAGRVDCDVDRVGCDYRELRLVALCADRLSAAGGERLRGGLPYAGGREALFV